MTRQTYDRAPRLTKLATAHISKGGYDICTSGAKCAKASSMSNQSLVDTSYVIRDMLHMVHYNDYSVLQKADVQFMLNELCTN